MVQRRKKGNVMFYMAILMFLLAGGLFLISYVMQDKEERLLKDKCFFYNVNQSLLYNDRTRDLLVSVFAIDSKEEIERIKLENPEVYLVDTNGIKYPVSCEIMDFQKEELYSVFIVSVRLQKELLHDTKIEFCGLVFGEQTFEIGSVVFQKGEVRSGWSSEIKMEASLSQNNSEEALIAITNPLAEPLELTKVAFELPNLEIAMDSIEILDGVIPAKATKYVRIRIPKLNGHRNGVTLFPVYTLKKGEETQQYYSSSGIQYLTALSLDDILEYIKETEYAR